MLVLGDGDGRFLARLVQAAQQARITSVDASAAMLARARARLSDQERSRVDFVHADARTIELSPSTFDAVVTLFFLDCFADADVRRIVARVAPALTASARWLFADFSLPARGWRRWRARLYVTFLYAFFRWETGIEARRLPDMEDAIMNAGLRPSLEATSQAGLLRTVLFNRVVP